MSFEPISASIMAGLSIGQSLLGSSSASAQRQQEYEAEKGRVQRQNALNMQLISAANKRTADIYGYQTGRFQQNLGFIQEDYARAGEDIQRELGQAFAQSAYSRQGQLAALSQAVGYNRAAFEGTSRSRQRADVMGTLGDLVVMQPWKLKGSLVLLAKLVEPSRRLVGKQLNLFLVLMEILVFSQSCNNLLQ